jgi:hypothetical protein
LLIISLIFLVSLPCGLENAKEGMKINILKNPRHGFKMTFDVSFILKLSV